MTSISQMYSFTVNKRSEFNLLLILLFKKNYYFLAQGFWFIFASSCISVLFPLLRYRRTPVLPLCPTLQGTRLSETTSTFLLPPAWGGLLPQAAASCFLLLAFPVVWVLLHLWHEETFLTLRLWVPSSSWSHLFCVSRSCCVIWSPVNFHFRFEALAMGSSFKNVSFPAFDRGRAGACGGETLCALFVP